MGRSFGPIREGRRSRPPRVSQLWVKQLVSTRHHWADIFIVRRQGQMGGRVQELNGHLFDLERDGLRQVVLAQDSPCDDNRQPYQTGSVAARVNKDRAFRRTPERRCQVCYWCTIEDSRKRQHYHRHLEHNDTKSCRYISGTNTQNGQVQMEHSWTL